MASKITKKQSKQTPERGEKNLSQTERNADDVDAAAGAIE